MTTLSPSKELTQAEFMALQKDEPGFEYEEGELVPIMSVEGRQSTAWTEVLLALGSYVRQHRLGRVWLDLLTYLEPSGVIRYFPDVVYLANDVLDRFDGSKIVGAPTLVVEVTAPGDDEREEGIKKVNYHRYGVPWYWIVNTRRGLTEEYRREEAAYALVSETAFTAPFRPQLFPGLETTVAPEDLPRPGAAPAP
jgi:Uma2 family endonuclease